MAVKDAGHGITIPYVPMLHSTGANLEGYELPLGGTPLANAQASADSWPRILNFLDQHLSSGSLSR